MCAAYQERKGSSSAYIFLDLTKAEFNDWTML